MATRVVVTLPDDVYRRVERLARLTSRDVADLLADTITLVLPPLDVSAELGPAITSLSDEEVLQLTDLQMRPEQDRRLSALLQKQQALLRKAQALHEAVRRGLRAPLEP
jgi:hypothetical protein